MAADVVVVVVVHAQEVDRQADQAEVAVLDQLFEPVLTHVYQQVGGVPRQQYRLEVHAVEEGIDSPRRLDVQGIAGAVGNRVGEVEGDAQLVSTASPKRFHRQPLREVLGMN